MGKEPVAPLTPEQASRINPGIRRTVEWMRSVGFDTCDSGDGATHDHPCDRDHPYVVAKVTPEELIPESHRLWSELQAAVAPCAVPADVLVQATYSPQDGVALVDLSGFCDRDLERNLTR